MTLATTHNCLHCGGRFYPARSTAKYCSKKCKRAAMYARKRTKLAKRNAMRTPGLESSAFVPVTLRSPVLGYSPADPTRPCLVCSSTNHRTTSCRDATATAVKPRTQVAEAKREGDTSWHDSRPNNG